MEHRTLNKRNSISKYRARLKIELFTTMRIGWTTPIYKLQFSIYLSVTVEQPIIS